MEITKLKRHLAPGLLSVLILVAAVFIFLNKDNQSNAADAREFTAGNIMSDLVMTNKGSMSEAQIQAFLSSKNPCNDRNISKAAAYPNIKYNIKDGKFVCLAEESFDGESAARIIWQAAQDYNINPQVLIVLLEKEQGLITDTWPNNIQYRAATGYGCPDTADCDGKYYGFKNQVRNAANFFRAYQTGNTGWYKLVWPGNKYTGAWQPFDYAVQLHPNAACGSINTRIENRATASLYSYTPYRPNQAALNAQYGHGDSCSSYGNRNFWMFFNDWFGSTHSPDTLLPHPDGTLVDMNGAVYLIQGSELHHIKNGTVFESHSYRWQDIKPATTGDRNLTVTWPVDFMAPGMLYTGDDTGVYTTVRYKDKWVKQLISYQSFVSLRYSWSQVRQIPKNHLPTETHPQVYSLLDRHPEGALIDNKGRVYLIDHGTLRPISAPAFESHRWRWDDIVPALNGDLTLVTGADVLLRQGSLVQSGPDLFIVQHPPSGKEVMRPIAPYECLTTILKYSLAEAISINTSSLPSTRGGLVTCQEHYARP
ncbi:hypothetical protein EOM57_02895 [Candidatus Saccharibacteria bacterium]|nr:hypothetical protein [Candidatus Saccharibacteria bacterium]